MKRSIFLGGSQIIAVIRILGFFLLQVATMAVGPSGLLDHSAKELKCQRPMSMRVVEIKELLEQSMEN